MPNKHDNGKGSVYRPVNREKYDKNYLKLYGVLCQICNGTGVAGIPDFEGTKEVITQHVCLNCNGLGYIQKERKHEQGQSGTVQ